MKRLETTLTKDTSFFFRVRYAITTSINSLLTSTKMFLSVGFVIIRRFGSYLQLQKWDAISDRADLEKFADLFSEPEHPPERPKIQLPEEFISLATENTPATGRYALKYLISRGVTRDDILKWKMHYSFYDMLDEMIDHWDKRIG